MNKNAEIDINLSMMQLAAAMNAATASSTDTTDTSPMKAACRAAEKLVRELTENDVRDNKFVAELIQAGSNAGAISLGLSLIDIQNLRPDQVKKLVECTPGINSYRELVGDEHRAFYITSIWRRVELIKDVADRVSKMEEIMTGLAGDSVRDKIQQIKDIYEMHWLVFTYALSELFDTDEPAPESELLNDCVPKIMGAVDDLKDILERRDGEFNVQRILSATLDRLAYLSGIEVNTFAFSLSEQINDQQRDEFLQLIESAMPPNATKELRAIRGEFKDLSEQDRQDWCKSLFEELTKIGQNLEHENSSTQENADIYSIGLQTTLYMVIGLIPMSTLKERLDEQAKYISLANSSAVMSMQVENIFGSTK